jgi:Ca2+-binding RTX toxin-like protein
MPNVIFSGEPMNGTAAGELIVDVPGGDGPNSTINGNGGDDLILGDSNHLYLNYLSHTNTSLGAAMNIDGGSWSTSANPLIGVAGPHTTVYIEPGAGEQRFFEVTAGAGETIVLDVDFAHGTGWGGTDTIIDILDAGGNVLASNDDNSGDFGSVGSFDSALTYVATAGGTYYIRVREFGSGDGNTFEGGEQILLNVSITNHAASSADIVAGNDTISGGDGDDTASGGRCDDSVNGDADDDVLEGDAGADTVRGGDGWDQVGGGDGPDLLFGGPGNDNLNGGAGVDQLDGGLNFDFGNGGPAADALCAVEVPMNCP